MEDYKNSMVFYESAYLAINYLQTNELKWEAVNGLFEYGFYGVIPESDNPFVNMIYVQAIPSMRSAKDRYNIAVNNGKKGGRPTEISIDEIIKMKDQGMTNKQVADKVGCTLKNIENRITIYNKSHPNNPNNLSVSVSESDTVSESVSDNDAYVQSNSINIDFSPEIELEILRTWKGHSLLESAQIINKKYGLNLNRDDIQQVRDKQNKDAKYRDYLQSLVKKNNDEKRIKAYESAIQEQNKMYETELSQAQEVVNAFAKYGISVSKQDVIDEYTCEIIEENSGCITWHMDKYVDIVNKYSQKINELNGRAALSKASQLILDDLMKNME